MSFGFLFYSKFFYQLSSLDLHYIQLGSGAIQIILVLVPFLLRILNLLIKSKYHNLLAASTVSHFLKGEYSFLKILNLIPLLIIHMLHLLLLQSNSSLQKMDCLAQIKQFRVFT